MASRLTSRAAAFGSTSAARILVPRLPARSFHRSATIREAIAAGTVPNVPVKKPVGAFRGGIFGFLLGSTSAFAGLYYYVLDEYKFSNGILTEDIYVRVCI